jgi:hypothetical protein
MKGPAHMMEKPKEILDTIFTYPILNVVLVNACNLKMALVDTNYSSLTGVGQEERGRGLQARRTESSDAKFSINYSSKFVYLIYTSIE